MSTFMDKLKAAKNTAPPELNKEAAKTLPPMVLPSADKKPENDTSNQKIGMASSIEAVSTFVPSERVVEFSQELADKAFVVYKDLKPLLSVVKPQGGKIRSIKGYFYVQEADAPLFDIFVKRGRISLVPKQDKQEEQK